MDTLYNLSSEFIDLEYELEENGGEMTEELAARYDENQISIKSKVDGYNGLITKLTHRSDNLAAEIKRLQALKRVTDNAKDSIKNHLLNVMQNFDIKTIEGNYCKVSRRASTSLEINEEEILTPYAEKTRKIEEQLPDYITVEYKISKTAIKEHFKDSDLLPQGATMIKKENITIR